MTNPQVGLFAVLDSLVTTLRATTGYGDPASGAGIPVYDGPTPTDAAPTQSVVIGSDGNGLAAEMTSEWLAFAPRADRMETGQIHCLITAWSGQTTVASTLRGQVRAMVDDLATAAYTVADAAIGMFTGLVDMPELQQEQTTNGLKVEAKVTIHYTLTRA